MILCLDVGNSRIKCAVVGPDGVVGRDAIDTARATDEAELRKLVKRVSRAVRSIDGAGVSSVVPPVLPFAVVAVEDELGVSPTVVHHALRLPFALAVHNPSLVGTDRLCAAAGALGDKGRNGIIVDAGSAITVDLVHEGVFRGGVILAGPSIALESLHRFASQLPAVDYPPLPSSFPDTFDRTEHAMILGAALGGAGGIRESVKFLEAVVEGKPRKFLTGGQAGCFALRLPRSWKYDPDLTLKGLHRIVSLNPKSPRVAP